MVGSKCLAHGPTVSIRLLHLWKPFVVLIEITDPGEMLSNASPSFNTPPCRLY